MKVSELISELKNVCPDFDIVVIDNDFNPCDVGSVREEDGEVTINLTEIY